MKRILKRFMPQTILLVLVVVFAVAAVSVPAAVNGSTDNKVDLSLVMTPETQLTVYVDGQYSGALSDSYGFGDTATITAPEVSGKTFSHWEADGSVISYANPLKLTINAHTTICAVYADTSGVSKTVAGFTSITRTNEGDKISFQAIASGSTVDGAGIVYSTTAIGENLKIGGTSVTAVAAERLTDGTTKLPESILDDNNCWMLQIKPTGSSTVYHARAYVTVGGNTTYGDVKDVKISELESGISMIANLEGFEPGTDDLLEEIAKNRANNPASVTNAPTAKNLNYNGQAQALVTAGEASGGEMQYALGTDATTAPANNLYTTTIPTATNAGTYYVWYKVKGDGNHNDTDANYVEVSIGKRSVTLTSATASKVYDGTALKNSDVTVSGDGFVTGEGATYDVTGSQTLIGESANVFTYALNDGTNADNYDITTVEGKLTVTKLDSSGEVTPESGLVDDEKANRCPIIILNSHSVSGLVYDGKAKALVTAGKTEGGTLMYRLGTDGKWQQDIPEATDAGTYKIYYYIKGDDNHKDDGSEKEPKGSVETTIKKAAQDKPTETFAVDEASDDKTADGKISGLDKAKTYQYSADDGKTWTDVKAGSTEIVVKSGTYQIRYAEDKNHEAGKAASVTVTAKAAPSPEPAKTKVTINLKSVTQKNNKVQVSWTKVNEADGYDVYINYCGSNAKKAAKTINENSTTSASFIEIDGKEINQKKSFHVRVYAYKMVNGKKIIIAKTITAHLAGTKSAKYTNPKALKLTKSAYQIKVKKTAQIEAKVTLENSSKMLLPESHASKLRYKSSNTKIATVNKNGKITGKSKGTCYIYVYTVNGLMKKVKVTVK